MSFVKNLRVMSQIIMISGVAVFAFITVGAVYYVSMQKMEAAMEDATHIREGKDLIDELSYDFLNARRAEKDFLLRLNVKYTKKHAEIVAETKPQIEELRKFHSEAETVANLDILDQNFSAYVDQFAKVTKGWNTFGLDPKSGLRGSLRKSVHEVETKLKEFNEPSLMVTMLMMRRHEKDFFMRVLDKYIGKMDQRVAEFNAGLAASTIPAFGKADISKKMAAYQKDFKAAANVRLQLVPDTAALSKLFAKSVPAMKAISENSAMDFSDATDLAVKIEQDTAQTMYILMFIATLIVAALSTYTGRILATTIRNITDTMQRLAGGDSSIIIEGQDTPNEIGEMAKATNVFKENMIQNEQMEIERSAAREQREQRTQKLEHITKEFGSSVTGILETVALSTTKMEATANSLSTTAEQTSQQAQTVAAASGEASSNVQTVASASEELSSSIQEISRQVAQSTTISSTAVLEVESTNAEIQGLADASNKIGEVVAMITDIADQTNLLALNATIEAARAGDAGKGFAVVASEVKNLANQTAKATEEISAQISGIQGATQNAVAAIGNIGGTINQLNEIASAIAAAVEEQGAATQEIARNVEQAANGTADVSSNIAGVTQAAGQTGAAAAEVLTVANEVSTEAEALKQKVDGFLADVKNI
ncbi:MAG: HAMP domain-containing protein [Magnetovibrio sp.]|nr:HAMP domain-containing protein [Magnetovibrio sp.]